MTKSESKELAELRKYVAALERCIPTKRLFEALTALPVDSRRDMASKITARPALLKALALDMTLVREQVGSNPNTLKSVLATLADSEYLNVVMAVASNPRDGLEDIFVKLARHKNPKVRLCVAQNYSAGPGAIDILAEDQDKSVRLAAMYNLNISDATLERIAGKNNWPISRYAQKELARRKDARETESGNQTRSTK